MIIDNKIENNKYNIITEIVKTNKQTMEGEKLLFETHSNWFCETICTNGYKTIPTRSITNASIR